MIIIAISVIMLIAGIILFVWEAKTRSKAFGSESRWQSTLGISLGTVGLIATLTCTVLTLIIQCPSTNEYEKMVHEKEVLVYQLENGDTDDILYSEIVDWNNAVRTAKRYYKNPFLNTFVNHKIAENLEYIELPKASID